MSVNFEQWWEENFAEKLGLPLLEDAFKEVAYKAWLAGQVALVDDLYAD